MHAAGAPTRPALANGLIALLALMPPGRGTRPRLLAMETELKARMTSMAAAPATERHRVEQRNTPLTAVRATAEEATPSVPPSWPSWAQ